MPTTRSDVELPPLTISDYVGVGLSRPLVMALCLAIGLGLALVINLRSETLYRASARLIVLDSQGRTPLDSPAAVLQFSPYFFANAETLDRAVATLGLAPDAQQRVRARVERRIDTNFIRNTSILEVALSLSDREMAGRLLRAIVDAGIELNRGVVRQSSAESQTLLNEQLTLASSGLAIKEAALRKFLAAARLGPRHNELDTQLEASLALETAFHETRMRQSYLGAYTARLTKDLSGQDKVISLRRNLSDEPEAAALLPTRPAPTASVSTEIINPLHEVAEPDLKMKVAGLAGESTSLERLESDIRNVKNDIAARSAALEQDDLTMERLRAEYDLTQSTYSNALTEYQRANIRVAERAADLRIFEGVRVGTAPYSPRHVRNYAYGAALGLFAGIIITLTLNGKRR